MGEKCNCAGGDKTGAERKLIPHISTCKFLVSRLASLPDFKATADNQLQLSLKGISEEQNPNYAHIERGRFAYQVFLDIQPPSNFVDHTCVSYHRDDELTLVLNEGESVLSHYA